MKSEGFLVCTVDHYDWLFGALKKTCFGLYVHVLYTCVYVCVCVSIRRCVYSIYTVCAQVLVLLSWSRLHFGHVKWGHGGYFLVFLSLNVDLDF